jgi:hypothetical protein
VVIRIEAEKRQAVIATVRIEPERPAKTTMPVADNLILQDNTALTL